MYDGGRIKPLEESRFFRDGRSARPLVEGTVPREAPEGSELLLTGRKAGRLSDDFPHEEVPLDSTTLSRGRGRYTVFCTPCHGRLGDGTGMVVQRGFPKPNSFHADTIRSKPAGHYFDVITNGFGRMYSYAPSIPVKDRWAIVAYIRALQLSRNVPARDLDPDGRAALGLEGSH
jgi:mono/diheme cytochrome c family protein